MSDRPHLMQLEPNEDVTSVRDRLSFIRGERVLLVWPEQASVLRRKLDLVLVQREAMRRAIRLALVTHDPQVIEHAAELNISTFGTIGESERKRWKRGRSKVFSNRYMRPEQADLPEDIQQIASRIQPDKTNTLLELITRATIGLGLVVVLVALLYVVVPAARVTLTPARTSETVTVPITAVLGAGDIDIENRIIPLRRLRVEIVQNGTIETTGTLSLADTRAAGTVVLINQTSAAVDVPPGTVVSTSAGAPIQFRTTEALTVPAGEGEQGEVPIEALQDYAGTVGNVDVGLVNTVVGPLAEVIEVRNTTPTQGGSSQTVRAVRQQDHDRLEATVRQQIQAEAFNEMQPLLNDTQFIILETLTITDERDDWKTFSAPVGIASDTLSLSMRAIVEAAAVDEQYGRQIVFANLSRLVPRGRMIQTDSILYTRGTIIERTSDGNVVFDMSASATVLEPVNPQAIQQALTNRTPQQALSYLLTEIDLAPGTVPEINLTPGWMRRMPILPYRIDIEIGEAAL